MVEPRAPHLSTFEYFIKVFANNTVLIPCKTDFFTKSQMHIVISDAILLIIVARLATRSIASNTFLKQVSGLAQTRLFF